MITVRDLFDGFREEVKSTVSYEQAWTAMDVIEAIKRDMMHEYVHSGTHAFCDYACGLQTLQHEIEWLIEEILSDMESIHDVDCEVSDDVDN